MIRIPWVEVLGHHRIKNEPGRLPDVVPGPVSRTVRIIDDVHIAAAEIFYNFLFKVTYANNNCSIPINTISTKFDHTI